MANQFEFWQSNDLQKPVTVQAVHGVVFTADSLANVFGVEVTDGGAPAALTGSVMGYAIRADGATLAITGTLSGNKARIVLPASAYIVPGTLDVVIKAVSGSGSNAAKTTLAAWRVYVQRSTTDTIVDPGHVIPSLEELLAQIEVMETATAAANAAAANANTKAGLADTAAANANAAADSLENMDATATTLAPGGSATAQVSTVDDHYRLALGIPQGLKGDTGDAALIANTAVAYQNSTSGTTVPTGEWLDTQPVTPHGQYLWTRTVLTWNNGQSTTLYSVTYQGLDGSGSVSSVNNVSPDQGGNITLDVSGNVHTVNGISPDANKNIALPIDSAPASGSANPVESGGVYTAVEAVKNTVGIVANGNTAPQAITEGQYVIWNGALYTASANIPSGDTLSASNLSAVSGGGLNDILGNYIKKRTVTVTTGSTGNVKLTRRPIVAYSSGKIVIPFATTLGTDRYVKVFDYDLQPVESTEIELTYYYLNVDVNVG